MLRNKYAKLLPKRRPDTHKGDYGRVLIAAGSPGMSGAAILASRGALRAGAGLVYLAVPREMVNLVDAATPEVITLAFEDIRRIRADVIAAGPGLGTSDRSRKVLRNILTAARPPRACFVIDADGLNIAAQEPALLVKAKINAPVIITPHPGELSRLTKKSIDSIQKDRSAAAREAVERFGSIVVLKGSRTVIANPAGKVHVNTTGNPGMGSGGVGDVLTGMIAGLAGQGLAPHDAAVLAVHLHGLAGDLAAKEKGQHAMIASDLVEKIPHAIQKII